MSGSGTESALGARLRAARESRQLSVQDAGRDAGIPVRYLEMLEQGEFPTVADPAYLTHFLRRYAGFLGLDAEASARDFLNETEPEATARRTGRAAIPVSPRIRARARRPWMPAWAVYALVLLGGLAGVFAFVRMQQVREAETHATDVASRPLQLSPPRRSVAPATKAPLSPEVGAPVAARPDVAPPPPGPPAGVPTASKAEPAPAAAEPSPPPAPARGGDGKATAAAAGDPAPARPARDAPEPAASSHAVARAPAESAPTEARPSTATASPDPSPAGASIADARPPFELRLTATSRQVWIWVSVDDGPRKAVSLEQGESIVFRADRRYVLSVDDAGGIDGSLNGKPLPSFGESAQARRNLVIPSAEFDERATTSRG